MLGDGGRVGSVGEGVYECGRGMGSVGEGVYEIKDACVLKPKA
jgi:hypothetical protein